MNKTQQNVTIWSGCGPSMVLDKVGCIQKSQTPDTMLFLLHHDQEYHQIESFISAMYPDHRLIFLPSWDCTPFDHAGPSLLCQKKRHQAIKDIYKATQKGQKSIIVTSMINIIQRLESVGAQRAKVTLAVDQDIERDDLLKQLESLHFERVDTVREMGEYAVRGGIIDIFPSDQAYPVRIDLFDTTVESIRFFDALSQRSIPDQTPMRQMVIMDMNDLALGASRIEQFCKNYKKIFGRNAIKDQIYQEISEHKVPNAIDHYWPILDTERHLTMTASTTEIKDLSGDYLLDVARPDMVVAGHDMLAQCKDIDAEIERYYEHRLDYVQDWDQKQDARDHAFLHGNKGKKADDHDDFYDDMDDGSADMLIARPLPPRILYHALSDVMARLRSIENILLYHPGSVMDKDKNKQEAMLSDADVLASKPSFKQILMQASGAKGDGDAAKKPVKTAMARLGYLLSYITDHSLHNTPIILCYSTKASSKQIRDMLLHQLKDRDDLGSYYSRQITDIDDYQAFLTMNAHAGGGVKTTKTTEAIKTTQIDNQKCRIFMMECRLPSGFMGMDACFISDADLFGEKTRYKNVRSPKVDDFITELSHLKENDYVVHRDHGIGQFLGLEHMEVAGVTRAFLKLQYHQDQKLFLPVQNIDLLSKYGTDQVPPNLDRLGGAGWQKRRARAKKRIEDIADELVALAAKRQMQSAPSMPMDPGFYDEFCRHFPYEETPDQAKAIRQTLDSLSDSLPMDRLIVGDVGFGKTEIALRAAFAAVMNGLQVAVVAPTTLLARQHFVNFSNRMRDFSVNIGHASRLVARKDINQLYKNLKSGKTDIAIGTHALLSDQVDFKNLGLLIIDEEQHFGVKQKEKIKNLKSNIHVLTLTATPIPRTLQFALSGLRELSLMATPPMDRLAVITQVIQNDPVTIGEAIRREVRRGGQVFYVCPFIKDLNMIQQDLHKIAPDIKVAVAHGQMSSTQLENTVQAFIDQEAQILLSTNIIESGIDLPNVNSLIVHRADRFGLSQLYQLRGRVGRSNKQAYAYFTTQRARKITRDAQKRLEIIQTLDDLGAGFTLAQYDMELRGGGNLLGTEQSGHVREVGIELYQDMLSDAIAKHKGKSAHGDKDTDTHQVGDGDHAPTDEDGLLNAQDVAVQISDPVYIPEDYITDLATRMSIYRRIGQLGNTDDLDAFMLELMDRFGPPPASLRNLLSIVQLKSIAAKLGFHRIDVKKTKRQSPTIPAKIRTRIQLSEQTFLLEKIILWAMQKPHIYRLHPDQKLDITLDMPPAQSGTSMVSCVLDFIKKMDE